MKKLNRRNFIKSAAVGTAGSVVGLSSAKAAMVNPVSHEKFIESTELISQRDQLVDSIIKRNHKHVLLSKKELQDMQAQVGKQLDEIFFNLAKSELTEADLGEITAHLTSPVEKKWVAFHRKCVEEARKKVVAELEIKLEQIEKNKKV